MKSAIILAAGEGKGAWPYAGVRQKVTVPVLLQPMVRRLAESILACGFDEIIAVLGHRGAMVRHCLGDMDQVRFVEQKALTGPVDAALAGIAAARGEDVLVCAGDIVTTEDSLRALCDAYADRKAEAMVLTAPCPDGIPRYTSVTVEAGRVTAVRGQGSRKVPRYGGIALARRALLERYLLRNPGLMDNTGIGSMPPVEGDVAFTFELMRRDGIPVYAEPVRDFLVDVDRPWDIIEANISAAMHRFSRLEQSEFAEGACVEEGAIIDPDARLVLGPGARIGAGCHIKGSLIMGANSCITDGAIIEPNVILGDNVRCERHCLVGRHSILGDNCIVSHTAQFQGIAFDTVYVYHYGCVTGLFGSKVDIGAGTVCGSWRFDNGVRTHTVKGHRETPPYWGAATYVGDFCRTGVGVMFMPGVKVGCYSCIGPGAIVQEDVPERSLLLVKQEQVRKEWGPEKYGW